MPLGASPAVISTIRLKPVQATLPQAKLTHVQLPLLRQLDVRSCIFNMRNRGHQEFRLDNGAVGRLIYREIRENRQLRGVYLGFALQRDTGEFTIHGRVVFGRDSVAGRDCLVGGYGLIKQLEPENTTQELLNDRSTPIIMSSGIRQGYRGIGSTLMSLLKGVAVSEGLAGVKILQSLSPEADMFYDNCGFEESTPGQWFFDAQENVNIMTNRLERLLPRDNIQLNWQPIEEMQTAQLIRQEARSAGLLQRLRGFFIRPRFAQAENL